MVAQCGFCPWIKPKGSTKDLLKHLDECKVYKAKYPKYYDRKRYFNYHRGTP